MNRKLIKQGSGNGLAVYLPKTWIDKMKLSAKDEIIIEEKINNLIISTNDEKNIELKNLS